MPERPYPTLLMTQRSAFHQQKMLAVAPPELAVSVLRGPVLDDPPPFLHEVVFLISERTGAIDADLIRALPSLRMILRLGSFAHDIDLNAARAAGVAVALRPQEGAGMVAEHIVMQVLALTRRLRELQDLALGAENWQPSRRTDENTFAYNWTHRRDIEGLHDKTVGILGLGEIGAELARRLRGWACTLIYHRRRSLPPQIEADLGLAHVTEDELLARSDILVNLLPHSPDTDMHLNQARLSTMKEGAYLVSCGSGSVIDEAALAALLRSGYLAGAALDTFEWEPIQPDNPLRLLALEQPRANVLLTPHVAAGAASAGYGAQRRREYDPIRQFLRGEPVQGRLV